MSEDIDKHVLRKYEIVSKLGKGVIKILSLQRSHVIMACLVSQAYGIVWKAIDKKTREVVALKKVFDAFQNATDAQRTFREIMFLQVQSSDAFPLCLMGYTQTNLFLYYTRS
jgi:mitogen-activated protein kinase 15